MVKLRIGLFCYNFPHYKSQQGIINLFCADIRPVVIFAQDKKVLKFHQSNLRISPRRMFVNNTVTIANTMGIPCVIAEHNSREVISKIKEFELDLGIILGARILKKETIAAFEIGIINMHPGLLPINRGLDNPKWAVIDNIKQGVTAHFIDEKIDMGRVLKTSFIDVFQDDTLSDIYERLQEMEQLLMIHAIKDILQGSRISFPIKDEGKYNSACTMEDETLLLSRFEYYKQHYSKMRTRLFYEDETVNKLRPYMPR